MNLVTTLAAPLTSARTVALTGTRPWGTWLALATIAFAGSLLVGASIAAVSGSPLAGHALWFTASAGIAWCLFGPALKIATGLGWPFLGHACLVAMAYGELVLAVAALTNLTIHLLDLRPTLVPTVAVIAFSNLTMAAALALQLRVSGTPVWKTLALWFCILDGAGAFLFYSLAP